MAIQWSQSGAVFIECGTRDSHEFTEGSALSKHLDRKQTRELAAGRKTIKTGTYRFEGNSNGGERLFEVPAQTEIADPPSDLENEPRTALFETLERDFGKWPEGDPDSVQLNEQVVENLRQLGCTD